MAEVIAKSKEHKFMRQQQQEEDENLRHELDQELDSIRSLLFAPDPSNQPAAFTQHGESKSEIAEVKDLSQPDDAEYDQFVRELAFEKRAKPKDRTKTEEEIALEEKEALEKAERRRIRRMNGEEDDSSNEAEGSGLKKGKRRARGGDDLDDDFMEEEDYVPAGLGIGLQEDEGEVEGSEESGSGEEDEDDEDDDESGDEDEEEDEDSDMPEDEDEAAGEAGDTEALVQSSRKASGKKKSGTGEELPFTFPCPKTHDEFLEMVENIRDEDVPTVVKRIRTLHHPSFAEDNKLKLQVRRVSIQYAVLQY